MIHITTQHHLHLWIEPIDFRKGIDALVGLCRQNIGSPYDGTVFAFRNKSGIAVKLLVYDGTGFWLCIKRFYCLMRRDHFWACDLALFRCLEFEIACVASQYSIAQVPTDAPSKHFHE